MQKTLRQKSNRDGAIIPLFAILLPVLLVLAAYSINLASMQLTTTELRIATDVTSHAGGRALNVFQSMDNPTAERVIDKLQETVDRYYALNTVAGKTLTPPSDPSSYIQFYNLGTRTDLRLDEDFHNQNIVSYSDAREGTQFNGVGVQANVETNFAFDFKYGGGSLGNFTPTRNSITRQTDRDIAIVIDRSGSMLHYKDNLKLEDVLSDMFDQDYITQTEYDIALGKKEGRFDRNGTPYFASWKDPLLYRRRYKVSSTHYQYFNRRWNRVDGFDTIARMQEFANANPSDPRDIDAMITYAKSWEGVSPDAGNRKPGFRYRPWKNSGMFNDNAPKESRWDYLHRGIQDFVDVLESTPAEETISLVVFDDEAEALQKLTSEYQEVLDDVEDIIPDLGTAIHKGLSEGLLEVLQEDVTRPFTEKIIVVMTDGVNSEENGGDKAILDELPKVKTKAAEKDTVITVHTLTFGDGTGITPNPAFPGPDESPWQGVMVDVAEEFDGQHFHAEDTHELQVKLREIANIQPTIFTY